MALQTACQNPTGRDISEERRARLAELAVERNFFVLEDRVYADANFSREPVRPLRELAPGHVIYVNSLSKIVGGGLRAGWVAARGPVRERIATLKLESDFHSPDADPAHRRALARDRAPTTGTSSRPSPSTASGATRCSPRSSGTCPGEYQADPPQGGHHVWVTLDRPLDERALYTEAARHGVAFIPGGAVTAERRTQTSMRLSFSLLDPPELDEGVKRLARAIREVRRRSRHAVAAPMSARASSSARARRAYAARRGRSGSRNSLRTPSRCVDRASANTRRPSSVISANSPRASLSQRSRFRSPSRSSRSTRRVRPLRLSSTESASSDMRMRPSSESFRKSSTS